MVVLISNRISGVDNVIIAISFLDVKFGICVFTFLLKIATNATIFDAVGALNLNQYCGGAATILKDTIRCPPNEWLLCRYEQSWFFEIHLKMEV